MKVLNRKASEIMTRPVVSAKENASARDVALQFITGLYSGMPVTDDAGKIVGIVTELDLLKAVKEGKELVRTTAKDIMTPEVATAPPDATVEQLVKIMEEFHILRLPIVKDEKLVGVVSRSDILRGLIEPEFMTHL
ncbi:MAG: CBS domain-containing protein [Nitrospinaceae bacterium]|nr:MAG: CBS domain-containing protein [Nitrospinaceae bacterium]